MPDTEIAVFQKEIANKPVGDRIALWAEKFVGTPYDPDPLGEYVAKKAIIADERVDCMYLSFRAVELAMSLTPDEALKIALDKRFISKGKLDSKGNVIDYDDRFQYGEDMLESGKWGKEITEELGEVAEIKGSRGREKVKIISKETLLKSIKASKYLASGESPRRQRVKDFPASAGLPEVNDTMTLWRSDTLKNGDFIFFIKHPEKRMVGEIVGHIGIIKTEDKSQESGVRSQKKDKEIYLIHASGAKNKGGEVKKVRFYDYLSSMPFAGIRMSRFD